MARSIRFIINFCIFPLPLLAEPLLEATRKVVPPFNGLDVSPIVWVALLSFLAEILTGPQVRPCYGCAAACLCAISRSLLLGLLCAAQLPGRNSDRGSDAQALLTPGCPPSLAAGHPVAHCSQGHLSLSETDTHGPPSSSSSRSISSNRKVQQPEPRHRQWHI